MVRAYRGAPRARGEGGRVKNVQNRADKKGRIQIVSEEAEVARECVADRDFRPCSKP